MELAEKEIHPELDPATYGFSEYDFDRPIFINYVLGLEIATLNEILDVLRKTYCSTMVLSSCIFRIQTRKPGFRNV